ncbi:acetate uptake transporter [Streptomyces sp. NBC_00234]|uniref:acetate uptake transporter n=1 Tax=Streptomyces sp. NBC_00234 TaxID=2903638 RepID=UPI002E2C87C1|nr:acetate uptake transporter [Streptomyces sp. NBC_00234]
MDKDVSAGSASTTTLGQLALGITLLAFGIGSTGVIDGVTAADAVMLALYVGGITLFVTGLLEFRAGNAFAGTAFAGLGAFWFTWGTGAGTPSSGDAAGLFLLLWALFALSLTLGAAGSGPLAQGMYGLLFLGLLLMGVGQLADSDVLGEAGGWVAAVAGLAAWYGATAALANWPTAVPRRAAGRGVTAAG